MVLASATLKMVHSAPLQPSIALGAFAESVLTGRRVLVFGQATSPLWDALIERGARFVHVCDPDPARVAEAAARNTSQDVSFAPLSQGSLAVRDGAFDVAFVENLASLPDPAGVMKKLRRALSARGVAFITAANPDAREYLFGDVSPDQPVLDYYALFDTVHREFPVVRMLGQMPFVGYTVAELAPSGEPEPCLDAGFVPGGTEEPEWFIAAASAQEVTLDAFVVVQLPFAELQHRGAERILREQLRAARHAERTAVERLARLEAEQQRRIESPVPHLEGRRLEQEIRQLSTERERREAWISELEARAATADARADEAEQELDEIRERLSNAKPVAAVVPVAPPPPQRPNPLELEQAALRRELELARNSAQSAGRDAQNKAGQQAAHHAAEYDRFNREMAAREQRVSELTSKLSQQDAAVSALTAMQTSGESQLTHLKVELASRETEVTRLGSELANRDARITRGESEVRELEAELVSRAERITQGEAQLAVLEQAVVERQPKIAELEHSIAERQTLLATQNAKLKAAETTVIELRATFAKAPANDELAVELDALEGRLRERGQQVRELERQLSLAEKLGKELLRDLQRAQSPEAAQLATLRWGVKPTLTAPPETQQSADASPFSSTVTPCAVPSLELEQLANLAATREADLAAAQWRIDELEQRLEDAISTAQNSQ